MFVLEGGTVVRQIARAGQYTVCQCPESPHALSDPNRKDLDRHWFHHLSLSPITFTATFILPRNLCPLPVSYPILT
jgi:hypothetical protein